MRILGISAFYHDSAAALLDDGKIVAAAQEERFSRKKHDARFPTSAIRYCLSELPGQSKQIDHVVFYEKPKLKLNRLIYNYLAFAPSGFPSFREAAKAWFGGKINQEKMLREGLNDALDGTAFNDEILYGEHHQSHAASAFFPSPFENAAVLTADGVGEWATTSLAIGDGNKLDVTKEIHFPHSLGLLYSAFTYHTGFRVNSGEYKLMGLAPYGQPIFAQTILDHLIDVKDDGSFRLSMDYFDYCTGLRMTNNRFAELFGQRRRTPDEPIKQVHMDLAASIQAVTEEVMLKLTRAIRRGSGERNLCLAGGVALNCVANGKILQDGAFDNIWVQPAAGDAGGALGAALTVWHRYLGKPRIVSAPRGDAMAGSYLGPVFENSDIARRLKDCGAHVETLDETAMLDRLVDDLTDGKAVGWFQGRMEYGPRALGARSILGDPRSPDMQRTLNLRVKYRESFRPFAPSVLREDVSDWFQLESDSPYMLIVAGVAENKRRVMSEEEKKLFGKDKLNIARSDIPAVTHVDYSARVQTVNAETNPAYHALISAFKKRTGCPVLVNTSFNVRGEPIVCTPEDAFACFMGTEMESLAIGNCYLRKEEQASALKRNYENAFELD